MAIALLAEAALRLAHRADRRLQLGLAAPLVFREGYFLLPPLSRWTASTEDGRTLPIETDEVGLRNPPGSLGTANLIVLGDSCVLADTTAEAETLVGLLRGRGWKAYNAGMHATGTTQALRMLDMLLARSKPLAVVLAFDEANDFFDNYWQPDAAASSRPSHAPSLFGRVRNGAKKLCSRSDLCGLAYEVLVRNLWQDRRRNPLGSMAAAELDSLRVHPGPEMQNAVLKTDAALGAISQLLSARGIRFVLLGIPSRAQVARSLSAIAGCRSDGRCLERSLALVRTDWSFDQPETVLSGLARRRSLPYVSLLDLLRQAGASSVFDQVDEHWNPAGQAVASNALAAALGPPPP